MPSLGELRKALSGYPDDYEWYIQVSRDGDWELKIYDTDDGLVNVLYMDDGQFTTK